MNIYGAQCQPAGINYVTSQWPNLRHLSISAFSPLRSWRLLRTFLAFIAFAAYFLALFAYVACIAVDGNHA